MSEKSKVDQLREMTKEWSNGAVMVAINEELHLAKTTEEKVELLQYKSDVLEFSSYGRTFNVMDD
ncbi:hypothetical protein [Alkalihalobacillus pseudalcaliphilus]|uniref:hypothetical protein n=1 Tax=Alkalihalobacillus pseudalcaliphilus TaxID=79884 RepID=UPI00064E021D|nr:hypothetical protein [Alkalihalobacillus pseudalcaliphilus]KMK77627.1 hypothetical protein AB990_03980 [Alkalihalobacillus pseudalcaliphilus]